MLINYIANILESNNYTTLPTNIRSDRFEIRLFGTKKEALREEYFVIIENVGPSENFLKEVLYGIADEIFDKITAQAEIADYFRKNCTLIICLKNVEVSSAAILEIEEDQYNFKKNVIAYSQHELESIKIKVESILHKPGLTVEHINSLINEGGGNVFRDFKMLGGSSNSYYSLLMKIFLKVPFLTYIPPEKSLHNLEGAISTSLTKKQMWLYDFNNSALLLNTDKNFDDWLNED